MNQHGAEESLGKNLNPYRLIIHPIPIPLEREFPIVNDLDRLELDELRVVCISRFVAFKIGAVVAFLRTARVFKTTQFSLVGHGSFLFLVKFLVTTWSLRNVRLYTDVSPTNLGRIVEQHHIGYAQGTAALEIAKYGKPVIIAPYSNLFDIFRSDFSTFGIFGEVDEGIELGDVKRTQKLPRLDITKLVADIASSYSGASASTCKRVMAYDSEVIFANMTMNIVSSAVCINELPELKVKPPIAKVLIRKLMKLLRH
jgi:hypothetical protein